MKVWKFLEIEFDNNIWIIIKWKKKTKIHEYLFY